MYLQPSLQVLLHSPLHGLNIVQHLVQLLQSMVQVFMDRLQRSRRREQARGRARKRAQLGQAHCRHTRFNIGLQGAKDHEADHDRPQGSHSGVRQGHGRSRPRGNEESRGEVARLARFEPKTRKKRCSQASQENVHGYI